LRQNREGKRRKGKEGGRVAMVAWLAWVMAALGCGSVEEGRAKMGEESEAECCGGSRQWVVGKQREKGRARRSDGGRHGSIERRLVRCQCLGLLLRSAPSGARSEGEGEGKGSREELGRKRRGRCWLEGERR
jgi:hypothetical protein